MKNTLLLVALLLLIQFNIISQEYSQKFEYVSPAELEMTTYPKDKSAEAVVVFDKGLSYFQSHDGIFNVYFERTTRVKVLTEAGIKWSEIEVPLYREMENVEEVYDVKANVYNWEDSQLKKVTFSIDNIYEERINDNWFVKKFALPNVKVGSIIEYKYKIKSPYLFNLRDWEFQWKIPVVFSQYQVKMIPFYQYMYFFQGANSFDNYYTETINGLGNQYGSATYKELMHTFLMYNMPAFNDEEYITSKNDFIIKLDFQLCKIIQLSGATRDIISTWDALIRGLLRHEDFGKYISRSEKAVAKLIDVNHLMTLKEEERFNFVMDYVKKNFKWNGRSTKYANKSVKDFLNQKEGSSSEINLFAIGALQAVGIVADPVIISTRDHGKIKYDYPFDHFFNYILLKATVDGVDYLSDATEMNCMNKQIPDRCINDKGLVVNKEENIWVNLECNFSSVTNTVLGIRLDEELKISGDMQQVSTGYIALNNRNKLGDNKEDIFEAYNTENFQVVDTTIHVRNNSERAKAYILHLKFKAQPEVVNDKIYISPLLNTVMSENPLKQKERNYPIDMGYPKKKEVRSIISVPNGYQPEYLPHSLNVDNDLFTLKYETLQVENTITVYLSYSFKKSVYSQTQYAEIKKYFSLIVRKGNEKIVLEKVLN